MLTQLFLQIASPKFPNKKLAGERNIKLSGIWAKCAVFWQFGAKDRQSHTLLTQHWKGGPDNKKHEKQIKQIIQCFLSSKQYQFGTLRSIQAVPHSDIKPKYRTSCETMKQCFQALAEAEEQSTNTTTETETEEKSISMTEEL